MLEWNFAQQFFILSSLLCYVLEWQVGVLPVVLYVPCNVLTRSSDLLQSFGSSCNILHNIVLPSLYSQFYKCLNGCLGSHWLPFLVKYQLVNIQTQNLSEVRVKNRSKIKSTISINCLQGYIFVWITWFIILCISFIWSIYLWSHGLWCNPIGQVLVRCVSAFG